jgi:hypothetical protein
MQQTGPISQSWPDRDETRGVAVDPGVSVSLTWPSTQSNADQERSRAMLNLTMIPTAAGFVGVTPVRHG